jgi:serine/threonine-protein kinase RsbW
MPSPEARGTVFSETLAIEPPMLETLHGLLARAWEANPEVGMLDRMAFDTALIELVGNLVSHSPGGDFRCRVTVRILTDKLVGVFEDTTPPVSVVTDRDMPGEDVESGRGFALMRSLGRLEHVAGPDGNRWVFERERSE